MYGKKAFAAISAQRRLRPCSRLIPVLLAVLLSACSMASSTLINTTADLSCTKDGGTYYLPRTMVKVVVHELEDPDIKDRLETGKYALEAVTALIKQDRRHAYCLDFLKSASAEEVFIVSRNEDLLLERISSTSDDKTKDIGKQIIKAIFTGLTHDPIFGQARAGRPAQLGSTKRFEVEYDPFDEDQAAVVNDALTKFGFCLVVQTKEFVARHKSIDGYCDRPITQGRREAALIKASMGKDLKVPASYTNGIYYRPRLPYSVFVFVKKNIQAGGGWKVRGSTSVLFENGSPVFSVAIDRTFFAKRSTTLEFTQGELTDVVIDKGSELKGFVELPLAIAQSIAAVPTAILQVRIDDTNNRHKLIKAQHDLLLAHAAYLNTIKNYDDVAARSPFTTTVIPTLGPLPFGDRSLGDNNNNNATPVSAQADSYSACIAKTCGINKNLPVASCQSYCSCKVTQCSPSGDDTGCSNFCAGLLEKRP